MKTIYNTLYRTFKNSIKNGGKDTALNYFGCKINYSTVLKNIEILVCSLEFCKQMLYSIKHRKWE